MATISRDWSTDTIGQLPAGYTSDTGNASYIAVRATQITADSPNSLVTKSDNNATHNLTSTATDGSGGNFTGTQYFRLGGNPIVQFYFRLAGTLSGTSSAYQISLNRDNGGKFDLNRVVSGTTTGLVSLAAPQTATNPGTSAIPENDTLALTSTFDGRRIRVRLQRSDGRYLTPDVTFTDTPTDCFDFTDSDPTAILSEGKLGYLWYAGATNFFAIGEFSYTATAAPRATGVTVAPATATVTGELGQQFTATVAGTDNPSQDVTWTASLGSINSGGLFVAPTATDDAQTATITATSVLDPTQSGTATVTVPARTTTGVTLSQMRTLIAEQLDWRFPSSLLTDLASAIAKINAASLDGTLSAIGGGAATALREIVTAALDADALKSPNPDTLKLITDETSGKVLLGVRAIVDDALAADELKPVNDAIIELIAERAAAKVAAATVTATTPTGGGSLDAATTAKIDAIAAKVSQLLIDPTSGGMVLAAAGLELVQIEAGVNVRQALAPILAAAAGVALGRGLTSGNGPVQVGSPAAGANPSVNRINAVLQNGSRISTEVIYPAALPLPPSS